MTGHSCATAFIQTSISPDKVKKMGRSKLDESFIYWREDGRIIHVHASNEEFTT
jgi:hypothetical protein